MEGTAVDKFRYLRQCTVLILTSSLSLSSFKPFKYNQMIFFSFLLIIIVKLRSMHDLTDVNRETVDHQSTLIK